jgi:hypothetical protein
MAAKIIASRDGSPPMTAGHTFAGGPPWQSPRTAEPVSADSKVSITTTPEWPSTNVVLDGSLPRTW